jgi:hypothetical protein
MFMLFRLLRNLSQETKSDTWQFKDVQAVQAFAQTFSRDKVVMTRGSLRMFRMFRLYRLLRKLS